jgi:hypothetical protein
MACELRLHVTEMIEMRDKKKKKEVTLEDIIETGGIMYCPDQDDGNPYGDEFLEYGHTLE